MVSDDREEMRKCLLARREADGSATGIGFEPAALNLRIVLRSSGETYISKGRVLLDPAGHSFEVTVAGIYADGSEVPICGATVPFPVDGRLVWSGAPALVNEHVRELRFGSMIELSRLATLATSHSS